MPILLALLLQTGPLDRLKAYLDKGEPLGEAARAPLSKADAEAARALLRDHHAARLRAARLEGRVKVGDVEMRYQLRRFGQRPEKGWSLWISMHGGGGAPKAVNDQQWRNQIGLYALREGIYVAPRAPTDTWDLWHQPHIDALFDRLISEFVAAEEVDPDRVYLLGYSAGGDGVYQLAPRTADRWAAAAMMAGHPNDASPLGLRNLPFALHVGANDAAYKRNEVGAAWGEKLADLRKADPSGYEHQVKIHAGKGHWMDLEDKAALDWMSGFRRRARPERVVWKQDDVLHRRFYWLGTAEPKTGTVAAVSRAGQTLTIETGDDEGLLIYLDDEMMDLDRPVKVVKGTRTLFEGRAPRTLETLLSTFEDRGDPRQVYSARIRPR